MRQEPFYRKVNTRARGVRHRYGGDYRQERNTQREKNDDQTRGSMHGQVRRGLDYTPLFRFLLAKVGQPWDAVFSEAVRRLDRPEPIFWLVALHEEKKQPVVCIGESSYYSGLFVDEAGLLQRVNPTLGSGDLESPCACCTHMFNGQRFTCRFREVILPLPQGT